MEKTRNTLVPYALEVVPRAGDREIRVRPLSQTLSARPKTASSKEKTNV